MAVQVTTTVTNVEVKGPFEKNGSQYDIHVFQTEAGEFSKSANLDSEPLANKGDTVQITYDSVKGKKSTYNKVLKLERTMPTIESLKSKKSLYSSITNKMPESMTKSLSKTEFKPQQKPFDNHSARVGGLLHDAVALLVHNGSINGQEVQVKDVIALAKELLTAVEKTFG